MANKKQKPLSKDYKVDAVYPVLCKECKSYLNIGKTHICWNPEGLPNAKPTDSCSRGERKKVVEKKKNVMGVIRLCRKEIDYEELVD